MGCCFSKKRAKHPASSVDFPRRYKPEDRDPPPPPSPEEEKVKEVLSETPSAKATAEPKPAANAAAAEEQEREEVFKVKAFPADAAAAVSDLGSCFSLATDERSEAASESSVATSSVMGPERSPRKPARRRPVSGELGLARRDRAAAAAYGVRFRSCRASPSPPPRREQPARDRSVRRSPSPAAKREQHRVASPAAPLQRKPPVPSRRASPHRAREGPPPPQASPPPQPEEAADSAGGDVSVADANAGGDGKGHVDSDGGETGKESLENPLVSMECFIFL